MSTTTPTIAAPLDFDTILAATLQLSHDERGELSDRLYNSLGPDTPPQAIITDTGIELTPEFRAELDRRIKEVEEGTAVLHPVEDVFREIYERLDSGDL